MAFFFTCPSLSVQLEWAFGRGWEQGSTQGWGQAGGTGL